MSGSDNLGVSESYGILQNVNTVWRIISYMFDFHALNDLHVRIAGSAQNSELDPNAPWNRS